MSKNLSSISEIAKLFNQSEEYTELMLEKHGIESLPRFRQPYDGLDAFYSDMTAVHNTEPSLTKQEFSDQCDPNKLVDRHNRGLDISMHLTSTPIFGDFTQVPESYHEAVTIVAQAKQSFMQLDADIRKQFDNDPAKFVDFVSNPENGEALQKMGLAKKPDESSTSTAAGAAPAASEGGGGEGA